MSAASRLSQIHADIARAGKASRRDPPEITLVAVSKRRSVAEIEALIEAGHLVGRLQSNKATEAVGLFDVIHSLDRPSLLDALAAAPHHPPAFVQVNIGEEEQKGGVSIGGLGALLDRVRGSPVPLAGLMAIPPQGLEPGPFFGFLNELARRHDVIGLSMGMSSDYATAVMLGATVVRVGTALFED